MYFNQLLCASRKVHAVYFDQLLGAAHCIPFISNHDSRIFYIAYHYSISKGVHASVPTDGVKVQKFDQREKGDLKCKKKSQSKTDRVEMWCIIHLGAFSYKQKFWQKKLIKSRFSCLSHTYNATNVLN